MNRREWLGLGAAWVCVLVSLPVLAAGGPFVVGERLGRDILAGMPVVVALVW